MPWNDHRAKRPTWWKHERTEGLEGEGPPRGARQHPRVCDLDPGGVDHVDGTEPTRVLQLGDGIAGEGILLHGLVGWWPRYARSM